MKGVGALQQMRRVLLLMMMKQMSDSFTRTPELEEV